MTCPKTRVTSLLIPVIWRSNQPRFGRNTPWDASAVSSRNQPRLLRKYAYRFGSVHGVGAHCGPNVAATTEPSAVMPGDPKTAQAVFGEPSLVMTLVGA